MLQSSVGRRTKRATREYRFCLRIVSTAILSRSGRELTLGGPIDVIGSISDIGEVVA